MVGTTTVARGKLYASVVAAIEADILSGARCVGDRLPSEGDLARQFAVSTRSVREALQVLETKGLVRRRHGERAEVVRDDVGQFLDALAGTVRRRFAGDAAYLVQLMDVRRMFETEVAGRLAAGEGAVHDDVARAIETMRAATDFAQYADADASFHRALVQSLGNAIMASVYDNLYALITDVIKLTSRVPRKTRLEGAAEHEAILEAIRSRDPDAARAAIREHIDNSTAYLRQAIEAAQPKGQPLP